MDEVGSPIFPNLNTAFGVSRIKTFIIWSKKEDFFAM